MKKALFLAALSVALVWLLVSAPVTPSAKADCKSKVGGSIKGSTKVEINSVKNLNKTSGPTYVEVKVTVYSQYFEENFTGNKIDLYYPSWHGDYCHTSSYNAVHVMGLVWSEDNINDEAYWDGKAFTFVLTKLADNFEFTHDVIVQMVRTNQCADLNDASYPPCVVVRDSDTGTPVGVNDDIPHCGDLYPDAKMTFELVNDPGSPEDVGSDILWEWSYINPSSPTTVPYSYLAIMVMIVEDDLTGEAWVFVELGIDWAYTFDLTEYDFEPGDYTVELFQLRTYSDALPLEIHPDHKACSRESGTVTIS